MLPLHPGMHSTSRTFCNLSNSETPHLAAGFSRLSPHTSKQKARPSFVLLMAQLQGQWVRRRKDSELSRQQQQPALSQRSPSQGCFLPALLSPSVLSLIALTYFLLPGGCALSEANAWLGRVVLPILHIIGSSIFRASACWKRSPVFEPL